MSKSSITMESPNTESKEALEEVKAMKKTPDSYIGYTNVDDMMKELLG